MEREMSQLSVIPKNGIDQSDVEEDTPQITPLLVVEGTQIGVADELEGPLKSVPKKDVYRIKHARVSIERSDEEKPCSQFETCAFYLSGQCDDMRRAFCNCEE